MKRLFLTAKTSLFLLFVLFIGATSYASHVAGGEITYQCIGPNQYQVQLVMYRDCAGIAQASSEVINYRSAACGVNANLTLSLVSSTDITPLCSSAASACNGGGGPLGFERVVYQGIVTLPSGCTDWIFSYDVCCRNGSITNLSLPDTQDLYVQTTLNNTVAPCNNSPIFSNNPQLFACVGQAINYQQLGTDPDGDVLVYSLVNAMSNPGTNVTYAGGFSGVNPFTVPASINASTGVITFTPGGPQVAVVTVLVQEFRGGLLVGSVMRDIQFNIVACTNNIPTLSGINNVPGVFTVFSCVGAPLCFTINSTDLNAGQAITLTYSNNIPGATFNQTGAGTNVNGNFCWTPTAADIGANFITVDAEDNACPLVGQNSRVYQINIIANPNPPVNAGPDVTICEGNSTTLTATSAALNIVSYVWTPPTNLGTPNAISTTASPLATTTYSVLATYSDGCISSDAVNVTVAADPAAGVFPATGSICPGGSFTLAGTTDVAGMTIQWFDNAMASSGTGVITGTTSTIVVTPPAAPGSYTYTYRVTNPTTGCQSQGTAVITVGAPPAMATCVNIYVTTTGLVGNPGTQAAPTTLANAIALAACNNGVIKMATGTYNFDNPINLASYITIEGGFTAGTWIKTSAPGATTINRTVLNPEGVAPNQRLVAFYGNTVTGFRFQDITITTANGTAGTGMSTYGMHLTSCSNYNIVRTQVVPGAAGSGANGGNASNGANGTNGTTGGGPQCTCSLGTDNAGNGGNGGAAGTGGANAVIIGGSAGAGAAGGIGGNGRPDNTAAAGFPGTAGTAAGIAAGGTGGTGGAQDSNGNSTSNVGNGGTGGAGTAGINGTTGVSSFVGGFFVPGAGTNGTAGTGGGGGGGGGGAARDDDGCDAAGGGGSGGGGGGGGGGAGSRGFGAGSSFGIFLFTNGANGSIDDSRIIAGAAGAAGVGGVRGNGGNGGTSAIGNGCTNGDTDGNRGGAGGTGGAGGAGGNGGNGSAGMSVNVHFQGIGSALLLNDNAFNLAAQTVITVNNVNCTNTNVTYTSAAPAAWDFDVITNFAVPAAALASSPTITQYSQIARYSLSMGANTYTGFHNISFSGSITPDITTNAIQIGVDTFRLCVGDFASFATSTPGISYTWNFNGAIANPGSVPMVASTQFNTAGFYPITLNVTTDCCGLSPTRTIYLLVLPNPNPTISAGTAICLGTQTTITLAGLTGVNSTVWSPTTNIVSSNNSTATVAPTTTTTYIATVSSFQVIAGHTYSGCPVNRQAIITVNPVPVVNMSSTPVICMNDGTATASVPTAGLYNFSWSNGGSTLNATNSTINSLTTGSYTVTATNTVTGCNNTGTVFVFPSASSPSLFVQSSTSTCVGVSAGAITMATGGGTANFSYTFNGVGPQVSAGTLSQTNLAGGNYLVSVVDNNGCVSNTTVNIPQVPLPVVIVNNNGAICALDSAIFTVEGTDGTTFTYNLGGANSTILLSDNPQNIIVGAPTSTVTMNLVSLTGGCVVPLNTTNVLMVNPCGLGIDLDFFTGKCINRMPSFEWSTLSETNNDYFTIEGSLDGENFEAIKSVAGAGTSTTPLNYNVELNESQNSYDYYRLKQTDYDGTFKVSDILYLDCNNQLGDGLIVFPNPTSDLINIYLNSPYEGLVSIEIADLSGRLVQKETINKQTQMVKTLSVEQFAKGNYFLHVREIDSGKSYPTVSFSVMK